MSVIFRPKGTVSSSAARRRVADHQASPDHSLIQPGSLLPYEKDLKQVDLAIVIGDGQQLSRTEWTIDRWQPDLAISRCIAIFKLQSAAITQVDRAMSLALAGLPATEAAAPIAALCPLPIDSPVGEYRQIKIVKVFAVPKRMSRFTREFQLHMCDRHLPSPFRGSVRCFNIPFTDLATEAARATSMR